MIILTIVEALVMAQDLPFFIALPIYGLAYAALAWTLAKAFKAWRDALKK